MTLSARDLAALAACKPTLRRTPRGYQTAPTRSAKSAPPASAHLVRSLVERGYLAWGNPSHGFATLTPAGGQAVAEKGAPS